ncbi:hypothetical protein VW35_19485 [Devosia soli]|uniref:Uncharacterized protein n=1 Tax=Devosia soli TaxID=361041 RepID=A0A0F5L141_9HYPH|nr:hypothetical protein [Devosia soli]KKB75929.1 hypothetical protein VW35_19485 [Devosia soli]
MMRNLFRVLLVSSALVAVTAPSAYATPQQEAAAAISNPGALPGLITNANFGGLSSAAALCAGNKACVLALLTAYAQLGFTPSAAQAATIAEVAGVTFTPAELQALGIGAITTTNTAATPLPGVNSTVGGGSETPSSTGPSPSAQ